MDFIDTARRWAAADNFEDKIMSFKPKIITKSSESYAPNCKKQDFFFIAFIIPVLTELFR